MECEEEENGEEKKQEMQNKMKQLVGCWKKCQVWRNADISFEAWMDRKENEWNLSNMILVSLQSLYHLKPSKDRLGYLKK